MPTCARCGADILGTTNRYVRVVNDHYNVCPDCEQAVRASLEG